MGLTLFDIAYTVKQKINSSQLLPKQYVSTDSLLPDKQGRIQVGSLPLKPCSCTCFEPGDVLVGNIRPYLKKIWLADCSGGCSNDVLVFRSREGVNSSYLYAVLLEDRFYSYVMLAPKGAKMPRGEESHILRYPIPELDEDKRNLSGSFIKDITDRLSLLEQEMSILEQAYKKVFDYWFLQFEFPDSNGKPYCSSGGAMEYDSALQKEIPSGWKVESIGEHVIPSRGQSYDGTNLCDDGIPMLNLASFKPGGGYNQDGIKFYKGAVSKDKILSPYDLVICNTQQTSIDFTKDIIGNALLVPDIFDNTIISSHHVTTLKCDNDDLKYYYFCLFNTPWFHRYIARFTNGTNILSLIYQGVEDYYTPIPPKSVLKEFAGIIRKAEERKALILKEIHVLNRLKDYMLPVLLNGHAIIG